MMEVKAYVFSHPAYGRLRVVKTEEGIFYNLEDVICLYEKSGHETFEVIADSEGQISGFEMNLAPEEKGELNFITDRELGYVGKRKKNVHTTQYFIDEVMLHDLETNLTTELKLVRKWIHGFVEKVLAKYDLAEQNRGKACWASRGFRNCRNRSTSHTTITDSGSTASISPSKPIFY